VYGEAASTAEIQEGDRYLNGIVTSLQEQNIHAHAVVRYSTKPRKEIVRVARLVQADLLVMAAHGHSGILDVIFGATINSVRHELKIPILVVREP
jgi:manganese transport protein